MLDKVLLEPVNLQGWLYWPFGTKQTTRRIEERHRESIKDFGHAIFVYDQEPIYAENLGDPYDNNLGLWVWSNKLIKLLPNSERSQIKVNLCNKRNFLDWYYFYHGFAALDWFHDAQFFDYDLNFKKIFCSFSHYATDKRSYRLALTSKLFANQLQQFGDISLHCDQKDVINQLSSPWSELTNEDKISIEYHLLHRVPLIIDSTCVDGLYSAHFSAKDYQTWKNYLFHIVNETVFYDSKLHLTEKIFKPIVSQRPFILVAAPGNLGYLQSYGFRTFDRWIDESYDGEVDNSRRLDMIVNEIQKLCAMSDQTLREMYLDMLDTLIFNKKHFFTIFKKNIVNELVDNFDQCLRQWNNGRVDGREIPTLADVDNIKRTLIGY